MSDPHDPTGINKPPRAEPLQPDKPAAGDDRLSKKRPEGEPNTDPATQSEDALKNVREGYD